MEYCFECGTKLIYKECGDEGMVQYCPKCGAFRFPIFNVAMSTVVFNKDLTKVLLIKQYNRNANVLVAGYVTLGEALEQTVAREVKEEIGIDILRCDFVKSEYFQPSNTLMNNFMSVTDNEDLSHVKRNEVDEAHWYTLDEAMEAIAHNTLAERFLHANFRKMGYLKS